MDAYSFPVCCGLRILAGFGNTDIATDRSNYKKSEIKEYIERQETYYSNYSSFVVTLNHEQYRKIGKVFLECGYKRVHKSYHPSHNSMIYLLVKNLHPEIKRRPKHR